ncbi:radical SAM protein [Candidatus Aminicenantes bacterium AC-708-M15]|jgi:heme b synthase|nr:radical SAM protein [SCandidatus Aminicenantes bacterium Aminicenantia_JdfR_composite]MCP2604034.1 radical SAM protein [Candidatus Aminicenantes bacterium AC-708-M15]MCP2618335.1 radical SAM protein [Candidatus Aminicenantes bacterium AC-335-A11]
MKKNKYVPRLIAWEVTRTCHLNCKHCRAGATNKFYEDEFQKEEIFKVLENIASFSKPIIILTGGEPMLREDIYEIASYGTQLGLKMVMAPCGMLITEEEIEKMKKSGIQRISLSLDGANPKTHDDFRQRQGAFNEIIKAAKLAKESGLEFQINTTVQKNNVHELPQILELVVNLGAKAFHPFLLVPTGRAKNLADQEISPEEYERILNWIYEQRQRVPIQFKPTCAPHYYRIFRQREKGKKRSNSYHGLDFMSKGCMGGQSFAFISHVGKVQICGFLEVEAGDLRKENYDFKFIWDNSPLFQDIRNIDKYNGRCGYCEFRYICGGCRARAFAISGNYLDEEPYCIYQPKRKNTK